MEGEALGAGVPADRYWDMTYGETAATIKSCNRRAKAQLRERAMMDHALANLIGISCARIMGSSGKYPSLHEAYPDLFDAVPEWVKAKARLLDFAAQHNRKRGENK